MSKSAITNTAWDHLRDHGLLDESQGTLRWPGVGIVKVTKQDQGAFMGFAEDHDNLPNLIDWTTATWAVQNSLMTRSAEGPERGLISSSDGHPHRME